MMKEKRKYSYEFLLSFKKIPSEPPESVKTFNDLYIYAPKPVVNRPVVDRSRGFIPYFGPTSLVSNVERRELHRIRSSGHNVFHANRWVPAPVKSPAETITDLLIDAQEQQATLLNREDTIGSAHKPTARRKVVSEKVEDPPPTVSSPPEPIKASRTPVDKPKPHRRRLNLEVETDEHKISQRAKQIGYGKVTIGYHNYISLRPKHLRGYNEPQTPNVYQKCSKRSWDGQLRKWRMQLHYYDPEETTQQTSVTVQEREELARIRHQMKEAPAEKASVMQLGKEVAAEYQSATFRLHLQLLSQIH
eukprot:TRINITY_DN4116_c0_g1_i1.p1 TRINITY_DN4116_c0_g1~~TRINITY_DN4116_c0_g1_i1.p1  ORF type:complete len:304 (+),score=35.41 TRINITY_DN4116_c0_g1_i1:83-994(+)